MEEQEFLICVSKYKKTTLGIQLDSYTGIISDEALRTITNALIVAASKSDDYSQIAKFVRLCDSIEEQRSKSLGYAERGEWGQEIK